MNIINAIINLVNNPVTQLVNYYKTRNRANNMGDALEEYVKDLFANSFELNEVERNRRLSEVFSYLGNNSNPPDAMLKNGDAIEVKKIESPNSALALNSSYPKHKLYSNSSMISKACRQAECWAEKDMIYAVGVVEKNKNILKSLCFVYGTDYCASDEVYSRIKATIKNGVEAISGVQFAETKELGHINKVDPLGITYMRVRGMWGIENPFKVFNYIYERDNSKEFNFMCIIDYEKWNSLDNIHELIDLSLKTVNLEIVDVEIKNPDNPAKLVNAKLIKFSR
ncbi:MAG: NgoPII family restriction endonuclease [Lachnospiraceae bacterium]|nr:NgoPII family restriction endonuclease [Lachnospiraceae bacterium]